MNIVFMGTPDFAVPSLEAIIEKYGVMAVLTQPDRPKGRGKSVAMSPVKQVALNHDIKVYQPEKLKNEKSLIEELKNNNFPHIIYKADNAYKIYTYGSTKRENIEEKLDEVRAVYYDAYIGQVHISKNQISYLEDDKGTAEVIKDMNSLLGILNESSDTLYKITTAEGDLNQYKEVLVKHQTLLEDMSEKVKNATLPKELPTVEDINRMIDRQEKNISESLKILDEEANIYELQNYFLDNVFRIIEIIKG